jgi:hypothetical protein
MNRTKKNILTIIVTLLLTASIGFTVYQIKSQNTPPSVPTGQMKQQSNGNSGNYDDNIKSGKSSNSNSSNSNSSSSTDIIKGKESSSQNSNQQTPPEKPSASDSNSDSQQNNQPQPPSSSSDSSNGSSSSSSDQKKNAPKAPSTKIATKYIVLLGAETFFWVLSILYLIFTGFHKRSFKEAFSSWKKFTICGISAILLTCGLIFGETYVVKQLSTPSTMQQPGNNAPGGAPSGSQPGNGSGSSNSDNDSASAKATASKTVSKNSKTLSGSGSARGLDATYGGTINADNVTVSTAGNSCASLATDRGEGTVTAKNSTLSTKGTGSPVIYSTGKISISNTTGTASGSQMVVIEGKNSATVTNSKLTASGQGNRNNVDNSGIMIYQSMSGDASTGTGTFTAKNSTLSVSKNSSYYKKAPMFFVTNTDAVINLTNTKLSYGSNTLLSVKGTSEWGQSGSNGGTVKLNASKQTLSGNISLDKLSTLTMKLNNSSTYTGTINAKNTAKKISLTLDSSSKIKLTGDSYVTSLNDADSSYSNIDFNGYKLYVNGKAIN